MKRRLKRVKIRWTVGIISLAIDSSWTPEKQSINDDSNIYTTGCGKHNIEWGGGGGGNQDRVRAKF